MDGTWRMIGFVPVRDGVAARGFYEGVLGMRFVEEISFAVVMERYPFADGEIWTAPNGDQIAWFKDPDGNVLSVSQHTAGVDLGL